MQDGPTPTGHTSRTIVSGSRRLIYLFLLLVLLACGLEGLLRYSGSFKTTRPFIPCTIRGEKHYRINPDYYGQFFSTSPDFMLDWAQFDFLVPAHKDADTYRIFVFGGSASAGEPDPPRGFAHILQYMLQQAFPEKTFDVYTVAFPAANSHVMLPLARACARMQPDLFLIYMGTNEFPGPFNSLADIPLINRAPLFVIRSSIACSNLRTLQLMRTAVSAALQKSGLAAILPSPPAPSPKSFDSHSYPFFYKNFESNLRGICLAGQARGAEVAVCTVGSNLRHWRPSEPLIPEDNANEASSAFLSKAEASKNAGQWAEARQYLEQASSAGASGAALSFALGQCYWRCGEFDQAQEAFLSASAADPKRWRVDPAINRIAGRIARSLGKDTVFIDTAAALEEASVNGVPGFDLFHDSCHPNFEGNYHLAKEIFNGLLCSCKSFQEGTDAEPPSLQQCGEAFAVNAQEEALLLLTEVLNTYVEFFQSLDFDDTTPALHERLAQLLAECTTAPSLREVFGRAMTLFPDSRHLRMEYVALLLESRACGEAKQQSRELRARFPAHPAGPRLLGRALYEEGQLDEAVSCLKEGYREHPYDIAGGLLLTELLNRQGCREEAVGLLGEIRKDRHYPPRARGALRSLFETEQDAVVTSDLEQFLLSDPSASILRIASIHFPAILNRLNEALLRYGGEAASFEAWQRVAQKSAFPLLPLLHLAAIHASRGEHDEAIQCYEQALPSFLEVLEDVVNVLQRYQAASAFMNEFERGGDELALVLFRETFLEPFTVHGRENDFAMPYDGNTLCVFSRMLLDAGQSERAIRLMEVLIARNSANEDALLLLVEACLEGRDREGLRQALAEQQSHGYALPDELAERVADILEESTGASSS